MHVYDDGSNLFLNLNFLKILVAQPAFTCIIHTRKFDGVALIWRWTRCWFWQCVILLQIRLHFEYMLTVLANVFFFKFQQFSQTCPNHSS